MGGAYLSNIFTDVLRKFDAFAGPLRPFGFNRKHQKQLERNWARTYGITISEYNRELASQYNKYWREKHAK